MRLPRFRLRALMVAVAVMGPVLWLEIRLAHWCRLKCAPEIGPGA